jgi:sec-independent protein translocase protein TatA
MARSLGRSLRIFKTEIKGMSEDDKAREEAKAPPAIEPASEQVAATPPPVVQPAPVTTPPSSDNGKPAS